MRISIGDREWPAVSPLKAELLHLMELRQQTQDFHPGGLGMKALQALHAEVMEARQAGEEPDEYTGFVFLAVMLFLSRRAAGEQLTFREAIRVPAAEIRVVPDEGDELPEGVEVPPIPGVPVAEPGVEPDPTAAADPEPAARPDAPVIPPPAAAPSSSTTSSSPSAAG